MEEIMPDTNLLKAIGDLNFDKKTNGLFTGNKTNQVDFVTKGQINAEENRKVPPFPIEVFPLSVQKIISATNESLNFPTDFIGSSILFASSIAIGNTHALEVKKGWQEKATLFIANVGKPNTNKSHPLSFALQPIYERDKNAFHYYQKKKNEYEQATYQMKQKPKREALSPDAKPVWQKSLIGDITPEALSEVHRNNMRGIGVHADELAGWYKNFNRYNQGSGQEFWLSVWSGKPINVDRKNSEPIFNPEPFISVIGNIPTGILYELAKDNRSQNGFIDRILFAFPDGLEKPYWTESELDISTIDEWKWVIGKLFDLHLQFDASNMPIPTILKFTQEAFNTLKQWEKKNTDLCRRTENELLAGIYGKFDIHVIRFALILEMLHFACGESDKQHVGVVSVNGARKLVEYFQATALKVHSIISNYNPLERLMPDKRKLYEALPDQFTTAQGIEIARQQEIPIDTFHKWLKKELKTLFEKTKVGEYEKLI